MSLKPTKVKPSYYACLFYPLKEIALKYGYNLVLHGSMDRDLDLIAIPWQEIVSPDVDVMIKEMADYVGGLMVDNKDGREAFFKKYHRHNYIIHLNRSKEGLKRLDFYNGGFYELQDAQYYLDISVTPLVN